MLKFEEIEIPTKGCRKLDYFKSLGYNTSGDFISVKISDLNNGSRILIDVICDYCNSENKITYKEYKRNISVGSNKYACSKKCGTLKAKETSLEKWGVENAMCLKETQEKSKKTNLERYGVEFPQQSDIIREKTKKTFIENWGIEHISKTDEFKERSKKWMSSDEFREKSKKSLIKNWGVEHPLKSEKIIDKVKEKKSKLKKDDWNDITKKIKKTKLEKWGDENYNNSDKQKETLSKFNKERWLEISKKIKKTKLEKWSDENYNNPDKIKESHSKLDWESITELRRLTNKKRWGSENILKSERFRKNKFIISKENNYISYKENSISIFKCEKGHEFELASDNYFSRKKLNIPLCTICNPIGSLKSIKENELYDFIKSVYSGEIVQSYRDGLEIDIYLPDLKLGFEFNGLYYHSDKYKESNYHLNKTKHFKEKGIIIIHIWEDDWNNKIEILKSQINNWLGLIKNKIFARKCEVREVKYSKMVTKFLEENHIQGKVGSNLKLGLYYGEELVSLMTFDHLEGRNKMNSNEWNINRFCNKINTNVIGGASKLFKHFLNNYDIKRIISYSDNDWSLGGLYEILGFEKVSNSDPDYKYIFEGKRVHKSRFRKSKTGLSESRLNLLKTYDCGKVKWEMIK